MERGRMSRGQMMVTNMLSQMRGCEDEGDADGMG